jgi:transposase
MIGLQPYSFSGSVAVPTGPGGCNGANMRRHPHAEEEKEPRELDRGGSRHAGGLDRSRPRPGAPVDPCAYPAQDRHEGGDAPAWSDTKIADALEVSRSTVSRVRTRFVEEGLEAALVHRTPRRTKPQKLDGSQEAHLIALACSEPPRGKKRWSVRLLAERFVSLECAEEPISRELVRRTLKKAPSSPG